MQSRIKYEWLNWVGKRERKSLVKNFGGEKIKYPPVFIVGAPRTGSTILYQLITNFFPVQYFSNYMIDNFQIIFKALKRQFEKFGFVKHNTFSSEFGETESMLGPAEGSYFWYQWFDFEKHYISQNELSEKSRKEIYSEITALVNYHNRPIVFKNLNHSVRLQALHEIFPHSLIIHIKREPLYTAQSIYKARLKVGGGINKWLSVKPKEYESIKTLSVEEQIAAQIFFIEKQIENDKNLFNQSAYLEISFEKLCADAYREMKKVEDFFHRNNLNLKFDGQTPLQIDENPNRIYLETSIFDLLRKAVQNRFGHS